MCIIIWISGFFRNFGCCMNWGWLEAGVAPRSSTPAEVSCIPLNLHRLDPPTCAESQDSWGQCDCASLPVIKQLLTATADRCHLPGQVTLGLKARFCLGVGNSVPQQPPGIRCTETWVLTPAEPQVYKQPFGLGW